MDLLTLAMIKNKQNSSSNGSEEGNGGVSPFYVPVKMFEDFWQIPPYEDIQPQFEAGNPVILVFSFNPEFPEIKLEALCLNVAHLAGKFYASIIYPEIGIMTFTASEPGDSLICELGDL